MDIGSRPPPKRGDRARRAPLGAALLAALSLAACAGNTQGFATTQGIKVTEADPGRFAAWTDAVPPYQLGAGDKLRVQYLLTPELSENVVVAPDGTVALRSSGRVRAEGRTLEQLEADIAKAAGRVLQNPAVTVSVDDPVSAVFFVGGSVVKAGIYPATGRRGVMEAIILANGLQAEARMDEVVLIRRNKDNKPMLRTVNLQQFASAGGTDGDVPLVAGDIVYVPRNRISEIDQWVDQFITRLLPFSRSFGYSINQNTPGALL